MFRPSINISASSLKNHLTLSFVISWFFFNYKIVLAIFSMSSIEFSDRAVLFKNQIPAGFWSKYWLLLFKPLTAAVAVTLIFILTKAFIKAVHEYSFDSIKNGILMIAKYSNMVSRSDYEALQLKESKSSFKIQARDAEIKDLEEQNLKLKKEYEERLNQLRTEKEDFEEKYNNEFKEKLDIAESFSMASTTIEELREKERTQSLEISTLKAVVEALEKSKYNSISELNSTFGDGWEMKVGNEVYKILFKGNELYLNDEKFYIQLENIYDNGRMISMLLRQDMKLSLFILRKAGEIWQGQTYDVSEEFNSQDGFPVVLSKKEQ